jgi:hypothetical protein
MTPTLLASSPAPTHQQQDHGVLLQSQEDYQHGASRVQARWTQRIRGGWAAAKIDVLRILTVVSA